jgi:hypothetical protein
MKLKGQLQQTDYINSQRLHFRPRWIANHTQNTIYILVLILLFGLLLFAIGSLTPLLLIIFFFGLAGCVFYYDYIILPKETRQAFAQRKELGLPFEIEFTENEMTFSNEFGHHVKPLEDFVKWREDSELIMLYRADNLCDILPKRMFADAQQIDTLKAYLKNKVKSEKSNWLLRLIIFMMFLAAAWVAYTGSR